jgi:DNA-binding LacI/PurR family transcriptional regulator
MITLKDIAERAGVHIGAVSYVLNDKPKAQSFKKETRERIIRIANELGYRRNAIAQSMKTGKTNVIGVVGKLSNSYSMEIIEGINNVLSKNNYMIKLFPVHAVEEVEKVKNVARQCIEQRLAGVICRSLSEEQLEILREELESNNIPIVLVDSSFSNDWCSRVNSDDFDGGRQATEYLLKLGHRNIAFMTNELKRGSSNFRYDGYVQVMAEWEINVSQNSLCIIDDVIEISTEQKKIITSFLERQQPTAVFCATDPIAMKLMNIAQRLGIKIPQELSVIGFAGLVYTAFSSPAMTTVKQPFIEMGHNASKILLSEIKEKSIKKEIKVPVKLMIRDSVGSVTLTN